MTDLDELERVAKAASLPSYRCYAWRLTRSQRIVVDQTGAPFVCEIDATHKRWEANATHIATFDPPTVLGLIARIRELEAGLMASADCITSLRGWAVTCSESATARRDLKGAEATLTRTRNILAGDSTND